MKDQKLQGDQAADVYDEVYTAMEKFTTYLSPMWINIELLFRHFDYQVYNDVDDAPKVPFFCNRQVCEQVGLMIKAVIKSEEVQAARETGLPALMEERDYLRRILKAAERFTTVMKSAPELSNTAKKFCTQAFHLTFQNEECTYKSVHLAGDFLALQDAVCRRHACGDKVTLAQCAEEVVVKFRKDFPAIDECIAAYRAMPANAHITVDAPVDFIRFVSHSDCLILPHGHTLRAFVCM